MANTRRKLGRLVAASVKKQPLNKAFLTDVMSAIEVLDKRGRRMPSRTYKPSSLVCMRQMYFQVTGEKPDDSTTDYASIGMADTGTRRHVAIQEAVDAMAELGYDWKYLDVEQYLREKWGQGKCRDIEIRGRRGVETALYHKVLNISFMCDGIVRYLPTSEDFLFEFKNQISFKYGHDDKDKGSAIKCHIDEAHEDQVCTYCMCLDLNKALVLYENRDNCNLECPEVFEVTEEMKQKRVDKILECDSYVERQIAPPMHSDTKPCRWCQYKTACKKRGK